MRPFLTLITLLAVGLSAWLIIPVSQFGAAPVAPLAPPPVEGESAPSQTPPAEEDEEDDEAAYRDVIAKRTIQENCLVCHEERMITAQRLTPAQWKSEVEKMVSWGAFVPESDQGPMIDYLARHFRDTDPSPTPERIALASVESPEIPRRAFAEEVVQGDPTAGKQLYMVVCANCHGPTAMGGDLGPSLANRAIIGHTAPYDQIVQKGLRKMPAFDLVLKAPQQHDILSWLRSLDRDTKAPEPTP